MSDPIDRSKFPRVEHHERGPLSPEDYFVLVPSRDPAAVAALRRYAEVCPDAVLATQLVSWMDRIEGIDTLPRKPLMALEKIPLWSAVLAKAVREGRMEVETALQRIAGHASEEVARALRDDDPR